MNKAQQRTEEDTEPANLRRTLNRYVINSHEDQMAKAMKRH